MATPENTFAGVLVAGGMQSDTAHRLSDFFNFRDWTQLWVFTDRVIDDIRAREFGDSSGDLVLSEEELEDLRFTAQVCRKQR